MITVIAGVNGAGKSSVIGTRLHRRRGGYFNPDEAAQRLRKQNTALNPDEANALAWQLGFEQLSRAVNANEVYVFETTLGGNSITNKLHEAIERGRQVSIFYCGLESVELHIQRVAARVQRGGHDIPVERIRQRYRSSRANLVTLVPVCQQLVVWDNSAPLCNGEPAPRKLLHLRAERFIQPPTADIPAWARPIAGAALKRVYSHR